MFLAILTYTSRMRQSILAVAALCVALPVVRLAAQQPPQAPPTFRSSVTLVTVDVVVLDHDARRTPVAGATPELLAELLAARGSFTTPS